MRRLLFACNNCEGLELFRGGIIRAFIAAGYEVHIVAPYGARATGLIAAGARFTDLRLSQHGMNLVTEWQTVRELLRHYRRIEPDLVFQYTIKLNIYGTYAAHQLGIPCICVVPGLGTFPDVSFPIARKMLERGYAFAARHAREIWFLNQHDYGFFESRGWLEDSTVRVLPGEGVDTSAFAPSPLPSDKRQNVLFVGRLIETKGISVFAETAALAKGLGLPIDFHVLGFLEEHNPKGISADVLQTWIRSGLLSYHGAVTDIRPYVEVADVVVLPTYFREGLNRVIMEAMSCGRPVITTDVPGAGELVVHNSTGYIVPIKDADAVLSALRYHGSLPASQREAMGRRARQSILERYDVRLVHGHYFDALRRVTIEE